VSDKIGYVVLHYGTIEGTANCVKSILDTQQGADYCVIVVNNGDSRAEELDRICHGISDGIILVHSKINNGFARGMNLGFAEAKYNQHCGFIVLLNNDTLMVQNEFSALLIRAYYERAYAQAGPKVLTADGKLTDKANPYRYGMPSLLYILYKYVMTATKYAVSYINRDLWIDKWQRRLERRMRIKGITAPPGSQSWPRIDNCLIHGCCMIFSPQYVQKYDGMNPRTFLYMEEYILHLRLLANGWTTAYLRDLSIIHLSHVATSTVVTNKIEKRRFRYRNNLKSYNVLIPLLMSGKRARQKA
jgi:GT2 family glycosyltransferase